MGVYASQENAFQCYVCKTGKGIECNNGTCVDECNDANDIDDCPSSSPWCEIEVKNHGGDLYMKKRCTQEEACLNQQGKNPDDCTDDDNPVVANGCTFCCNETLCNYNLTVALRAGANSVHIAGSVTFFGFLSYIILPKF
ncbi:uncharacterized protein LOC100371414 [Saccoglossus kowalevskii]|uniref:Uncharacterized protein LOC100371414 n=1 Tax=Saccoglossus kowalevskii TaxID=10224 RepID=A0ABM0GR66_SACKO|nr:PREDICTED: uncharacterized protein LOC100371414 [Saccoglossus kowalevskii]